MIIVNVIDYEKFFFLVLFHNKAANNSKFNK